MSYKIKKKTNGKILINNIEFDKGKIVEVTKDMFEYITKTFKDLFEVIEQPKQVTKTKATQKQQAVKKGVKDN